MDEATELKLLEELLVVGQEDLKLDDGAAHEIDNESAIQVIAAAFHSESRAFPIIYTRAAPPFFKGRMAVDWMIDNFLLKKREEAVFIGQILMDKQIVKPKPKKTLLDDLISAKESKADSEEIGIFIDADDKLYMFQKAPLMMENYIRKHLPISITQLLKDYPPPTPPSSSQPSPSTSTSGIFSRTRATTSLASIGRSGSFNSFSELPKPSKQGSILVVPQPPNTARPSNRRHGRSASVNLSASALSVPLRQGINQQSDQSSSTSPLVSPRASPRHGGGGKFSKARRASLVLKEKFLIFKENRDRSDSAEDKEEWEKETGGEESSGGPYSPDYPYSSDDDSDSDSSSDDSDDDEEDGRNNSTASSGQGKGLSAYVPNARRRATLLFSPLKPSKESLHANTYDGIGNNRDRVKRTVDRRQNRRSLDVSKATSDIISTTSAQDSLFTLALKQRRASATETSTPKSSPSSPRTQLSPRVCSSGPPLSGNCSPRSPPKSPSFNSITRSNEEGRESREKKGRRFRRGKGGSSIKRTSNPLYGTSSQDLEEMLRAKEERAREKERRRQERRARKESNRTNSEETTKSSSDIPVTEGERISWGSSSCDDVKVKISSRRTSSGDSLESRSRGGSSEGDIIVISASSSNPSSTSSSPPRDKIDGEEVNVARGRWHSDGGVIPLREKSLLCPSDKVKVDVSDNSSKTSDSPKKQNPKIKRASSLRVNSSSLFLGRWSSSEKRESKDAIRTTPKTESEKQEKSKSDKREPISPEKKLAPPSESRHRRKSSLRLRILTDPAGEPQS